MESNHLLTTLTVHTCCQPVHPERCIRLGETRKLRILILMKLFLRIRDSSRMQIRWTNGSHMRPKGQANKGRQGDSEILSNHLSPFGLRDLVV
ncbi:hypothetical protein LB506_002604 [Fusarium annulatum]|nr:hypothetical protein LB506_002604 [Fusarium annulatum]